LPTKGRSWTCPCIYANNTDGRGFPTLSRKAGQACPEFNEGNVPPIVERSFIGGNPRHGYPIKAFGYDNGGDDR